MRYFVTALCAVGLMTTSCASETPKADSPPNTTSYPLEPISEAPVQTSEAPVQTWPVHYRTTLIEMCKLPEPKFEFDSAKVKDAAEPRLDALTTCMKEGALKGKSIQLIGHADKRGPEDYNMELGQERADSVKDYLTRSGVEGDRVTTSSLGETRADAENGWADDRRVDVDVVP